jgi:hypothetical protein
MRWITGCRWISGFGKSANRSLLVGFARAIRRYCDIAYSSLTSIG